MASCRSTRSSSRSMASSSKTPCKAKTSLLRSEEEDVELPDKPRDLSSTTSSSRPLPVKTTNIKKMQLSPTPTRDLSSNMRNKASENFQGTPRPKAHSNSDSAVGAVAALVSPAPTTPKSHSTPSRFRMANSPSRTKTQKIPPKIISDVVKEWTSSITNCSVALGHLQEKVNRACELRKDGLLRTAFDSHKEVAQEYAYHNHVLRPHEALTQAYSMYNDKVRPLLLECDPSSKSHFTSPLKRLTAALFFHGHFYKAMLCLRDHMLFFCRETDVEATFQLWCVLLQEWEILESFQKSELCSKGKYEEYDMFTTSCDVMRRFSAGPDPRENCVAKMYARLADLADVKTFASYEEQLLLHQTLASAYKSPGYSPKKYMSLGVEVQDGFYHMEKAYNTSEVIVKNRSKTFLSDSFTLPVFSRNTDSQQTLKLASSVCFHFLISSRFIHDAFKAGQIREACGQGLRFWVHSMKLACHTWVVKASLAMWWFRCTSDVEPMHKDALKEIVRLVYAEVIEMPPLNVTNARNEELNSTIEPEEENAPSDTVKNTLKERQITDVTEKSVRTPVSAKGNSTINVITEGLQELAVDDVPPLHVCTSPVRKASNDCVCPSCEVARMDPIFYLEWRLFAMAYEDFPTAASEYNLLEETFTRMRELMSHDQINLLGKTLKPRPPVPLTMLWVTVLLAWLRINDGVIRSQPSKEVRSRCLMFTHKVCTYAYVQMYAENLALKQAARGSSVIPKLSWMRCSRFIANDVNKESAFGSFIRVVTPTRWMRLAISDKSSVQKDKKDEHVRWLKDFSDARKEFTLFSHLLYRDWRLPICSMIAQRSSDPWEAAMHLSEMVMLGARHAARTINGKMRCEISDPALFSKSVGMLPDDMTVVQLVTDDMGTLHLVKLHKDKEPVIVPLAAKYMVSDLVRRMKDIVRENDETGNLGKLTKDAKYFWSERRRVDESLKEFIHVLAGKLGPFQSLFLPNVTLANKGVRAAELMQKLTSLTSEERQQSTNQLPLHLCKELVFSFPHMEYSEWKTLVGYFCEMCGVNDEQRSRISRQNAELCVLLREAQLEILDKTRRYTLLVVSPELSAIPWEALPIFAENPYVGRLPSIHLLFDMLQKKTKVPLSIDPSKGFYVMDPDNNLQDTTNRLAQYLGKFGWNGVVGQVPKFEDLKEQIENNDLYVYLGHGSGTRYFSRSALRRVGCRAVCYLMGCSSVSITPEGRGLDGKSAVFEYAIANCPCVVGCLWMVTDGEIDRYFIKLADYLFDVTRKHKHDNEGDKLRMLMDAMAVARKGAKLPYLTGAAVVSYGLPVATEEPASPPVC